MFLISHAARASSRFAFLMLSIGFSVTLNQASPLKFSSIVFYDRFMPGVVSSSMIQRKLPAGKYEHCRMTL